MVFPLSYKLQLRVDVAPNGSFFRPLAPYKNYWLLEIRQDKNKGQQNLRTKNVPFRALSDYIRTFVNVKMSITFVPNSPNLRLSASKKTQPVMRE